MENTIPKYINWILIIFIAFCLINCENKSPKEISRKITPLKDPKICIQPFGNIDTAYAWAIKKQVEAYYGFETVILTTKPLPEKSKNIWAAKQLNLKLPLRYRADSLIAYLKRNIPKGFDHIIGITNQDITTTNRDKNNQIEKPEWIHTDWGIFGLGYRPGKSCVVSTFRIQHYYQPNITKDRVGKVAKHELGHNLGLNHCPHYQCFMRQVDLSNAIRSLDAKPHRLCDSCRKVVQKKYDLKGKHKF